MNHRENKPVVERVSEKLRQQFQDRTYPPGARLPSESALAKQFNVSRTTMRTVLARFAQEGVLLRKQGDGTYVNERLNEVDAQYGGVWDFSRLIEANGYSPSIRTLAVEQRVISFEEATALEITSDIAVISIARLFCADGRPVIYARNVFPSKILNVEVNALDGNMPIHKMMQRYCAEQISYVMTEVEAAAVDKPLKGLLERKLGEPLLKLKVVFHDKANVPLIAGTSFYDFSTIKLRLVQAWG